MIFIETPVFTEDVAKLLSEEEYRALQISLAASPDSGDVIQGTGGLRKVRWGAQGRENEVESESSTTTSYPTIRFALF